VATFLDRWLVDVHKPAVRPSTFRRAQQIVRLHLVPELGRTRLTKLTPDQVQHLLNAKFDGGLSACTVWHIHAVLRGALNHAVRWGLVNRNVACLARPPRVPKAEIKPFDPAEARAFLEAIKGERLEAVFVVAMATGLRQGELLGLRWQDVDLDAGTLQVRHALQTIAKVPTLIEPKSHTSRRTIVLPAIAVTALKNHRQRQVQERLVAGPTWVEGNFTFASSLGKPLAASWVYRSFKRVLEKNGFRDQRFHDLRHCCASLLLACGVSPRVVMEQLGHSQISLTLNTYSHCVPALMGEAAERMDALLTATEG
jgi:integrase